jgi:hypothetical protein
MNRILCAVCVAALTLVSVTGGRPQEPAKWAKGTVCWPLHLAGITVGLTTDSQAQRLLGQRGIFRADEGHTGGRYFLDVGRTVTMHIVGGVDKVTEQLTFAKGVDPAIKPSEQGAALSKWIDPQEGFGNWRALHLGSAKKEVLDNLGEPQKKLSADEWIYETTCACELPEYFTLKFLQGRIVQLVLSAED